MGCILETPCFAGPLRMRSGLLRAANLLIEERLAEARLEGCGSGVRSNLRQCLAVDADFALQIIDRHVGVVPDEPRLRAEAFGQLCDILPR